MVADSGGIAVMPGFPGTVGRLYDSEGVLDEPEGQTAVQAANAQFGRFDQQVTQVIEHTEMQLVGRTGRFRDFGIIAPRTGIDQRIAGWMLRIFERDEKAAGDLQQVGVLRVSMIQELDIAVIDMQGAERNRQRLADIAVGQQPGIVSFAGWRIRNARQVYL